MGYIFNLVIVCLFVFTAGQSADLSIGVSYISTQGESVSYQLFQGDSNNVQVSTVIPNKLEFLSTSLVAIERYSSL